VPDYTPPYPRGDAITLTASSAVSGGDLLEVSGNNTVAKTATLISTKLVGVAADDTPTNGRVTVWGLGPVHIGLADGTITAGDQIGSTNTAGRQVKTIPPTAAAVDVGAAFNQAADNTAINGGINAAVNAARGVIGVALTTASDGNPVRWMMAR
jgi:hypothetical protein